jgi:hypothetical protein
MQFEINYFDGQFAETQNHYDLDAAVRHNLESYWEDHCNPGLSILVGKAAVAVLTTVHRESPSLDGWPAGVIEVSRYDGLSPTHQLFRVAYLDDGSGGYASTSVEQITEHQYLEIAA